MTFLCVVEVTKIFTNVLVVEDELLIFMGKLVLLFIYSVSIY